MYLWKMLEGDASCCLQKMGIVAGLGHRWDRSSSLRLPLLLYHWNVVRKGPQSGSQRERVRGWKAVSYELCERYLCNEDWSADGTLQDARVSDIWDLTGKDPR